MPSGKKPVSCISCAKRKVSCDKSQPCSNCKRRKGDVCIYRAQGIPAATGSSHLEDSAKRIERLESYVRRLGGDLALVDQDFESCDVDNREATTWNSSDRADSRRNTINSPNVNTARAKRTEASIGVPAGLVETDEGVTCIEAPMWYSWSGASKSQTEPQVSPLNPALLPKPKIVDSPCFSALLDPMEGMDGASLLSLQPPPTAGVLLWKYFLKNVHPLVMIFFDWEVDTVIHKASHDPASLKLEEQALVSAIYFITTLSLSEEQCFELLHSEKIQLLKRFQQAVESSLLMAEFIVTSDRVVLQAFILYLLTMRNRARPAAIHSLMGIASRIAERMGLQHDGSKLRIPIFRSEERRRMWWQLQHMECDMGLLIGNISMTIYADWDTHLPSNLEDRDLNHTLQSLPPPPRTHHHLPLLVALQNPLSAARQSSWRRAHEGFTMDALPSVSLAEKDSRIDITERTLGEQFLQYCEPLNPLHVHIQIGVRLFVLAARRVARQPALVNVKISAMSRHEREAFLGICTRCLEYYLLSEVTESLRGYRWHNENYFPWPGFVYTILEAHHHFDHDTVDELWLLIGKIYSHHPTLMTALSRPDIASIARITIVAWQRRYSYQQQLRTPDPPEVPTWMQQLRRGLNLSEIDPVRVLDMTAREPAVDVDELLPMDFDFDVIDWTFWENPQEGRGLTDRHC